MGKIFTKLFEKLKNKGTRKMILSNTKNIQNGSSDFCKWNIPLRRLILSNKIPFYCLLSALEVIKKC